MSETLLQKNIKERDLQRMRNLITKKFGDKTGTSVGYSKVEEQRNEGDVWEENGKTWTIKNGIKMTISKLDNVKKTLQIPLICPNCKNPMKKKKLDTKMYGIHKMCFDCVVAMETKLKLEGKYDEYCQKMIKKSAKSFADEIRNDLKDVLDELKSKEQVVSENGEIEEWGSSKIDIEQVQKDIEEYISQLVDFGNS
jgi:hypothetical protein